jgi:hypothetical protein
MKDLEEGIGHAISGSIHVISSNSVQISEHESQCVAGTENIL